MTDPYEAAGPHRGLDPALDPDRFVPDGGGPDSGDVAVPGSVGPGQSSAVDVPGGPLDPRLDPDRYENAVADPADARGKDLTQLIGKDRSFEEERSPYLWVAGLLMVLGFLALVSLFFANTSPR
jgi:hypothetical protein